MKFKLQYWLLRVFIVLTLIPSCLSADISKNSRQGSETTFSTSHQGSTPTLSATTAGFLNAETKLTASMIVATKYHGRYLAMLKDALGSTIALTNRGGHAVARIGYDAFGNLKFPNKPGHENSPCREDELHDWLDRFDFGRSFGFDIDGYHWGRHHAKNITPFLFASRRLDSFSNLYNHRNRFMNPRFGRFTSRDPIGFEGDLNLYRFAKNNPVLLGDAFGLQATSDKCCDHDFLTCFSNCIEANDPLNLLEKGLLSGAGGAIPKVFVEAIGMRKGLGGGGTRFTTIPSVIAEIRRMGVKNWLRTLGRVANVAWIGYGVYMAGVEVYCGAKCLGDPCSY